MSLSAELVLGSAVLMGLLGGIVWRATVLANREDAKEAEAARKAAL